MDELTREAHTTTNSVPLAGFLVVGVFLYVWFSAPRNAPVKKAA